MRTAQLAHQDNPNGGQRRPRMTSWYRHQRIGRRLAELVGPVPQTPWYLTRFCHPMWGLKNTSGDKRCSSPAWSGPEVGARVASLRCPILRSGPDQYKSKHEHQSPETLGPIENACRITGGQGIT